jgi:hypothetical protein
LKTNLAGHYLSVATLVSIFKRHCIVTKMDNFPLQALTQQGLVHHIPRNVRRRQDQKPSNNQDVQRRHDLSHDVGQDS